MTTTGLPTLKQRLLAGETLIAPLIPCDSPMLIELCGLAGFDFVFLDTEHGAILHPSYESLIRAADAYQVPTIVRVGRDQPLEIARALDAGAQGIHVPFIESADQARAVVDAARFYPEGQRGLGPVRAARYGFMSLADYVTQANEQTLVVAAVESPAAVEQIGAIGSVPGVDVIFIAPADLSAMLGHPGEFEHPDVSRLIDRAIADAQATGKIVGSLALSPAHARQLAEQGVRYILMILTGVIVRSAEAWLAGARQAQQPN